MKRFLFLTILFFSIPSLAHGATEFVSIVDTGGATDADYSTLNSWESAIGTNLTAPSTIVFSGTVTGTAPVDGSQVTLYRSGASQGVGATVVHTAKTNTQILLKNVSDPSFSWASGDQWRIDASNYFQIDDVTHDQPQVTAKCRATTGAADTTSLAIDGWDTDSTHYIKIWTDPSENYRHQGKWDIGKYRLEVNTGRSIDNYEYYVRIDGLQIKNLYTSGFYSILSRHETGGDFQVSNSIFNSAGATGNGDGISADYGGNAKIWNNILYGFLGQGIDIYSGYAYNNTVLNSNIGIASSDGTGTLAVIKNNLSYNNTDNYNGSFSAFGTNNLTSGTDPQIPATNKRENVTVTFADAANNDFHLDSSDTGAKNQGIILYDSGDDSNLSFTTDIDNEARKDVAGSWDIGADENVAKIYRSVGAGATSPLAWGGTADSSYGNMTISGLIATFWRPLPDNVGVGDALQYDADNTGGIDNIVFITKRIDSTHYSVRKSDGTAPTSTSSLPNNTWAVYRSYISLSNAEAGTENTGISDAVENFDTGDVNLTTNNLQWNFACYANGTAADSTAVVIDGWTTTADNYIRIFTPTRTDEVGTTQRHNGKWDTSKYNMSVTDTMALHIMDNYVSIDGIQLAGSGYTDSNKTVIAIYSQTTNSNKINISNIIINRAVNGYYGNGISISAGNGTPLVNIWNSVIIGSGDYNWSAMNACVYNSGGVLNIYNSTLETSATNANGLSNQDGGTAVVKNAYVKATSGAAYSGTITMTNAASSDATGSAGLQNIAFDTTNFTNVTVGSEDLHLGVNSALKNTGTDLSNDLTLPIKTDIDSSGSIDGKSCDAVYQDQCLTRPRSTSWDIGADELITKIYRSVGVGTTAAIISGTSPAISLTISGNTGTFSTFPTSADFGVGDVIRYDSDNNGTLDSTAFISAIDSTAKTATLQDSTGASPVATSAPDYDWKLYRAYTSLSDWESGTENTGIGVTYDAGNRDIATNSEQWNVACYANSGTAPDTTAVTISGWTTKPQNYIKVYTPTLSSEVTTSQRHQGKYDSNKYRIEMTNVNGIFVVGSDYVKVDGLQIKMTVNVNATYHMLNVNTLTLGFNKTELSNNVLACNTTGELDTDGIAITSSNDNSYIWNNIFYDFRDIALDVYGKGYIYNNTFIDNDIGIYSSTPGSPIAKNNIVKGSGNNYSYIGTFNAESDYNATDSTDDIGVGTHNKISQTFSFIDSANRDYHLSPTDTAAKDAGADLSKDLYLPVTSDIDGQSRPINGTGFSADIGADEGAIAIYRSIAPSATGSIASGTSPANSMIIAGTSVTFGTAPGDTVGVGDAIQYDSDNNGSIDSIAFIAYRNSSTSYVIQDRTGGTPTSTSATDYDWSIFRAYTSLQNASGSISGGAENTGLADAIEHFDIDWSASHGKNIYTNNQQWNIAAYANSTTADTVQTLITSWTTYPTNYLKIYTPNATTEVGISQRHQGKWDTAKYYRTSSAGSSNIYNYTDFLRVDGLQIQLSSTTTSYTNGIYLYPLNPGAEIQLSNNIIRGVLTDSANNVFGIKPASVSSGIKTLKLWNNILYDFINGTNSSIEAIQLVSGYNTYLYNNTVYNSYYGYHRNGGTVYAKNNIAQNCTDGYYGTFDSSSDYNISDVDASDAPNATFANDYATVTFADSGNDDFHLGIGDTAARNSGADLSADAYLPITTDIDGHTRPTGTNAVDIGADEGATAIYYSVGQSTSTDFKVASNVTVSGYTATFATAQTGNMGVGDVVTYSGGSCYITGKTSTSIWSCSNVTGGTAPQVTGVAVTSIKRAFASLNSAMSGSTAPQFLNTTDLKTNNYQLNIPCYMDSGTQPDTTAVTIQGYTTAVPNYIKVYTPNNTTTEANQSQRHQGKWDSSKYSMQSNIPITIYPGNVYIEGLQIKSTGSGNYSGLLLSGSEKGYIHMLNNIIQGSGSADYGIRNNGSGMSIKAYNNIVYDFVSAGFYLYYNGSGNNYIYNNTVYNCGNYGYWFGWGLSNIAKNNIAQNCTDGFKWNSGGFSSDSDYNISDQASDAPSASYRNNLATTVTFQDSANKDYHLGIGDTAARNQGINIGTGSTEPYLVISTDIDGNTRNTDSRGWDIGADEAATQIYYSVGQSSSDLKTGSPTLSIDSSGNGTLSVSQTGNMGVGDYIEYGTSPYNKAYIAGKTSSTVWTVQAANGTMLGVATTEPVNSIKHAYTTLNGAIAGASGSTMMNTTDLYTNNYQLNIPCYYDSAADTTATTISGYTTYSMNYIKVYTPTSATTEANNSQRHQGKWDEGKYSLSSTSNNVLITSSKYVKFDGLQIKQTRTTGYNGTLVINFSDASSNIQISNNVFWGITSGSSWSVGITSGAYGYAPKTSIWNNIFYGYTGTISETSNGIRLSGGNWYIYNNSFINCSVGIARDTGGTVIAKNNVVQGAATGYAGSFNGTSTNNLSNKADAPGTNPQNGKTVNFVDSANYDFHLAENDTSARNAGADLSTDTNLAVTTDIDGNSRPTQNAFDIGADEGSTYIYYSVGQNTNDHKTGSPTITLSGYSATLSVGQTAPNMGVGDLITYSGGSCYITAKTNDDKMHWNCQNATGGTAPQVSGVSVTSIAHAFNSLGGNTDSGALSANSGQGAKNSSHLNTSDLYSGNYVLNIPCYYDNAADTSPVTVSNWTTAANNYIKVYTPTNTSTEANSSQRHSGKWDTGKYYLNNTNAGVYIYENYFWIDGIQLKVFGNDSGWPVMIEVNGLSPYDNKIKISNNILQADYSGMVTYGGNAVSTSWGNQNVLNIWNNVIYDSVKSTHFGGLYITGGINYVYNNTFVNLSGGIYVGAGTAIAKNNIVQNTTDGYNGGFASGSDYNISNVSSDTTGGAHDKDNTTVTFVSSSDNNYHLSMSDTAAKNQGVKLASYSDDSNLNFTTDIDGNSRTGSWSIGADDGPFAETQSDIDNPIDDPNIDINNGLVGYWSFNGEDMKGVGIGGTALDKSGNGNDGILSGTAPGPTAVEGKRGQALSLDGADDRVKINNNISDDLPAMTVSFWFKSAVTGNPGNKIISKARTGSLNVGTWEFTRTSGGTFYFTVADSVPTAYSATKGSYQDIIWHHIVGTYDGSQVQIYIDTSAGTPASMTGNTHSSPLYPVCIGASNGDSTGRCNNVTNGTIDEVRIYNRALSADEIGHLYRMGQDTLNASQEGKYTNGLVGHWTFDGQNVNIGATAAYDSSGNNYTGKISGATQTEGKLGQAMNFDGSDDYINAGTLGDAAMTENGPLTISAWIKPRSNSGETWIAARDSVYLTFYPSNYLFFGVQGGTQLYRFSTQNQITLNTWQHITMTWDGSLTGSNIHFYINGSAKDSTSQNGVSPTDNSTSSLHIGNSSLHNRTIDGALDDVRIYNRVLSVEEIGDLYNAGKAKIKE